MRFVPAPKKQERVVDGKVWEQESRNEKNPGRALWRGEFESSTFQDSEAHSTAGEAHGKHSTKTAGIGHAGSYKPSNEALLLF